MSSEAVTILSSVAELAGLGAFFWYVIKGLRAELSALRAVVDAQKQTLEAQKGTLEAMEGRVAEAEKVGALYRKLIKELPEDVDSYKKILRGLKDQVIEEQAEALRRKDEKLAELTKSRLDEIEKQESLLEELPALQENLRASFENLEGRLAVLDLFQPGTPLGELLEEMQTIAEQRKHRHAKSVDLVISRDYKLLEEQRELSGDPGEDESE